jgi:hypothetical protein
VLNPVVLATLLGGAHNDAMMIALVTVACVLTMRHHPVWALVFCVLAAEVKLPALLCVAFLVWWTGREQGPRRLALASGLGLVFVAAAMLLVNMASGLGFGWVRAVLTPGKVVSWLDPATAVGLTAAHLASALSVGVAESPFVTAARAVALVAALVLSVWLLARSTRSTSVQALGWGLLLVALLGPVVWPWYETWGVVVLAAGGLVGRRRTWGMGLSAVACFADVPSAHVLFGGPPLLVALVWAALVLGSGAFVLRRVARPLAHS